MLSCTGSSIPNNMRNNVTVKPNKDSIKIQSQGIETIGQLQTVDTTITVSLAAIECGCPQWFETKFGNKSFLKDVERFYVEPMNKTLVNANALWDGQSLPLVLKLVGRFSKNKEFPDTYNTKTTPERARIFRYSKIIIVSNSKIDAKKY